MTASDIKKLAAAELAAGARLDFTNRDVWVKNLQFLYHVITATEPLLALASENSTGELQDYFKAHFSEEKDHAAWLKDDLEGNVGTADMLCAAMVGSQYYLVNHVDACALLGYQLVLECFPYPVSHLEYIENLHGARLFRTLRYHAVHDLDHGAEVLAQIDKLEPHRLDIVLQSAVHTARCAAAASHSFA